MLRGLAENRCPECGRGFDPNDARTMRFGKRREKLQRWLVKPLGWPLLTLAMLATAGVLSLTRWPAGPWSTLHFSTVDFRQYKLFPPRPTSWDEVTPDYRFAGGLSLWPIVIGLCVMRGLLRWGTIWLCAVPRAERSRRRWPLGVLFALMLVSVMAVGYGWPFRAARPWVAAQKAAKAHAGFSASWGYWVREAPGAPCPLPLDGSQQLDVLRAAIANGPISDRFVGLQLLMEERPNDAVPVLAYALSHEHDASVRTLETQLLALYRDPTTAEVFAAHLVDPDPTVRAAAADGLGILHGPSFEIPACSDRPELIQIRSNPPIQIGMLAACWPHSEIQFPSYVRGFLDSRSENPARISGSINLPVRGAVTLPPSMRESLERMMLAGASSPEREAAARALVGWPPGAYSLRVAEWGVWLGKGDGSLKLLQSELGEIPTFVHATGNPAKDFAERVRNSFSGAAILKPILHFTSDVPMAVDVQVVIRSGRPWFAYPMPDDFAIAADGAWHTPPGVPALSRLDNPKLAQLSPLIAGYPWAYPQHRDVVEDDRLLGHESFAPGEAVTGLGLRWQSLIISPQKLAWMRPPEVGADPKYQWWNRLREVPCDWVSSRGEAERFAYYDGPTFARTPVTAGLGDAFIEGMPRLKLRVLKRDEVLPCGVNDRVASLPPRVQATSRWGLFIRVREGRVEGYSVEVPVREGEVSPGPLSVVQGEAVAQALRGMVTSGGLTGAEADGLVDCWRPQFFEREGSRFVLVMSAADYDAMCPMQIRPTPTEVARVGLVLTEFSQRGH